MTPVAAMRVAASAWVSQVMLFKPAVSDANLISVGHIPRSGRVDQRQSDAGEASRAGCSDESASDTLSKGTTDAGVLAGCARRASGQGRELGVELLRIQTVLVSERCSPLKVLVRSGGSERLVGTYLMERPVIPPVAPVLAMRVAASASVSQVMLHEDVQP